RLLHDGRRVGRAGQRVRAAAALVAGRTCSLDRDGGPVGAVDVRHPAGADGEREQAAAREGAERGVAAGGGRAPVSVRSGVAGRESLCVGGGWVGPPGGGAAREPLLFVALTFWLVGGMLYVWLIALIFYRVLFLPLAAADLTPPYWINMGAMAISTLAGASLLGEAGRSPLLADLLPFLKGTTLLFWATATWWIPILLVLGAWRHLLERVPLIYEHDYWAVVFPLGMYAVCTQTVIHVFSLPFLEPIAGAFVWIALGAWALTLVGLARYVLTARPS